MHVVTNRVYVHPDWQQEFEKRFEEESDDFIEFVHDFDYDREDDWFSDRKGGYDVEWSIED